MAREDYKSVLRSLGYDRHKMRGRRVRITNANRKSNYGKTLNAIGTIKNTSSGIEYGILLDDLRNPSSEKGLFWFKPDEFEFLNTESEENNMEFKIGDTVKVIRVGFESYGMVGIIIKDDLSNYPNCVLVKFDNWNGKKLEKTLYIRKENLVEVESEENNMAKLTGYKKVAVIDSHYYAVYDDGMEYQVGSRVIVSGSDLIHTISEIITLEEASKRFKGDITAEVITVVDTSAYDKRVAKRKEAEELKKNMDKVIKEMDEVNKYELYAKQNPDLKEMLDKYKELLRL